MRFCIREDFPATHRIRVDTQGTLEPLHAHNWRITAWLSTNEHEGRCLRQALEVLAAWVMAHRGRCFNDIPPFDRRNPTAEEVARELARILDAGVAGARVHRLEVGEAAGFSATYWPVSSQKEEAGAL
ncbi:MAG: 6-pyruvoyl tetrahydropterin synthase family protein [Acidobacteriota bacterium]